MARFGAITIEDGVVQQNFFSDYHITRMHTMPPVESYLVASEQGPSGASETVACVVAPALANALAQATCQPFRQVPLRLPGEPAEVWDVPASVNTFAGARDWNPPTGWLPISARE
jgi:isoquinoline 1-oxidoreductase beta subunit